MSILADDYKTLVLDDLKMREGISRPISAGLFERLLVRKTRPSILHPNPDDEFSDPNIGPNYEIVENYARTIRYNMSLKGFPYEEPLIVEKISTGGYMLLNGHHRWLASHRCRLKKVPVSIANVIPKEEIISRIHASDRTMCATFDLDEVLLTDRSQIPSEEEPFYYRWLYKKTLRKNACALISQLQEMGFDVWVYSGLSYSEKYINSMFQHHRSAVDGIVNCAVGKRYHTDVKENFRQKYSLIVNIDNKGLIWVKPKEKDYDSVDFTGTAEGWASETYQAIVNLGAVKKQEA